MNDSLVTDGMSSLNVSISNMDILKVDMLEGSESVLNRCRGPTLVTSGGTADVSACDNLRRSCF